MNTARLRRVAENMRAEGLKQILVTAPASVDYLSGVRVSPGERMVALLVKDDGSATLFANRLFALKGAVNVPLVEHDDTDDCVGLLAKALDNGKIGIDKAWPSGFTLRLMAARGDIQPVLGSRPVDDARMCKDAEEIDRMRRASEMNDQAVAQTVARLRAGMTEREACEFYLAIAKSLGAQGPSFPPLICFGANGAQPHHDSDETALRPGDAVILDVGLLLDGYCSDMTRTVFFGSATDEERKVYDLVKRANEAGRAAVRPGVPMKEFDRAARSVIEQAGYGDYFIHRTGHGIGLEVHEPPDNSAASEVIAQPGMVFSVEPGVYLPGRFGVRVEDLIAVTETGAETLNHLPREIQILPASQESV